ncbi:hypothetical protein H0A36_06240 [Endozoicomonas sp. SM1973]|uniref:Uncharacterized protein n=1 Tax=Spartinivicinus marinus TaxID=2994442 RepID=A0A853I8N7_9GAMM|nr:hypothetical protein [Spartinivicinus marinus]MCX4028270.1 hypothetical protein [Spartinivicinus marinus]NYZ65605.1 hypothetical protein [Spartinivicinus marinus]
MKKQGCMSEMLKSKFTVSLLAMAVSAATMQAVALPKPNTNTAKLDKFQSYAIKNEPLLKGVSILGDHDPRLKVLYVSPSSKKTQTGSFEINSTPGCNYLQGQYNITYNMPSGDLQAAAKAGPFSPYFDSQFGNYVRQTTILDKMANKIAEIDRLKEKNKTIVAKYTKYKFEFDTAQADFDKADSELKALSSKITELISLLGLATDEEEIAALKEAIAEAKQNAKEKTPEAKAAYKEAYKRLIKVRPLYSQALGDYQAAIPNIEEIEQQISTLSRIFVTFNNSSIEAWDRSEEIRQKLETTPVGIAAASYSIWGQEETLLRAAVNRYSSINHFFHGYTVSRLPIFNIKGHAKRDMKINNNVSGSTIGTSTLSHSTVGDTGNSHAVSTNTDVPEHMFTKDGATVEPEAKTLKNNGAGNFRNVVTRGAYCTGSSTPQQNIVKAEYKTSNYSFNPEITVPYYKSRSSNVLAQTVAFDYDYFVKTDPINVSCRLDIEKFQSFIASKGSSGFLFWRKSWSETERKRIDKSGMKCDVDISPSGANPDPLKERQRIEDIRQMMIKEIAAEFILTYAKSWKISQNSPVVPNGEGAKAAGTALMSLCGGNMYCQVGSIILKNGAELFGSNKGRTKNKDFLKGVISRHYKEQSFTINHGTAVVDVNVRL